MKIAVIGLTGRMSKVIIEEIINNRKCELVGILARKSCTHDSYKLYESIEDLAKNAQAIIDFTNPTTSIDLIKKLANTDIIYVCGTTGFNKQEFEEFQQAAKSLTTIWSPNMSIGINLLQMLLKVTATTLGNEFDSGIIDIHHKHKKDSPSGTAIMLANTIEKINDTPTQISSLRMGEVPGEHQVIFSNSDESITLSHHAFNRKIFATGAIKACLWGKNKPKGLYSMQDVLLK